MTPVKDRQKRYAKCFVSLCAGCERLHQIERRDLPRSRASQREFEAASTNHGGFEGGFGDGVARGGDGNASADLALRVIAGDVEFDDIMPQLNRAFLDRLGQAVAMSGDAP